MLRAMLAAMLVAALMGCEKPVEPNPPEKNDFVIAGDVGGLKDSIKANDSLRLTPEIQFRPDVDTGKVKYSWTVLDGNDLPVPLDSAASKFLSWVPKEPGHYSARLKVDYDGEESTILVILIVLNAKKDSGDFARIKNGIIGNWKGVVTTPWKDPYEVSMSFRTDGTYSSKALDTAQAPALYYGSDDDSPEKTYALQDLRSDGEATGSIIMYFWPGDTLVDNWTNISLSEDGSSLSFDIFHEDVYGPVHCELKRQP